MAYMTKEKLASEARSLNITGRSKMTADELRVAVEQARTARHASVSRAAKKPAARRESIRTGKNGATAGTLYRVNGTLHKIRRTPSSPLVSATKKPKSPGAYEAVRMLHWTGRLSNARTLPKSQAAAWTRTELRHRRAVVVSVK